jgi:hypothetical protein
VAKQAAKKVSKRAPKTATRAKDANAPSPVAEWLGHVKALAEGIGPRGPTREGERLGAEYAKTVLDKADLAPVWETFRSARSIFHPHLAGSLLMLAAFVVFPVAGAISAAIAAVLGATVIACELLELGIRPNPLRALNPHGRSQNVHAIIPPKGRHERDLVLVGHVDTQRTPFVFRSPRWVKVYERFTMVAFAGFLWQTVVFALAAILPLPWAWPAAIPGAVCAALLAALCIQAESTPFTAGANDNASAVGMVLTLARHVARRPLERTRVLAVITGCEEVQHYGMADFYRRHRAELKEPRAVVFEMLGCAGPSWLVKEGIIVPFRPDPTLLAMVEKLAAANPAWQGYPSSINGGNTEMADAVRARVPAITLGGMTRKGVLPFWHQPQDTFDKMDPAVMARTWEMTLALIREIDRA